MRCLISRDFAYCYITNPSIKSLCSAKIPLWKLVDVMGRSEEDPDLKSLGV
jgi:hypothetical protein